VNCKPEGLKLQTASFETTLAANRGALKTTIAANETAINATKPQQVFEIQIN
jgi:hypothetical protein